MSEDQNPNAFQPNRAQRRAAKFGRVVMVPTKDLVLPQQQTDEQIKELMLWRIQNNVRETQHPLHHLTANGVIVDDDPTLEYCMKRLRSNPEYKTLMFKVDEQVLALIAHAVDVPKAVPVNCKFYGHDPYATH